MNLYYMYVLYETFLYFINIIMRPTIVIILLKLETNLEKYIIVFNTHVYINIYDYNNGIILLFIILLL